jgi:DNA polymerase III alpha subunit
MEIANVVAGFPKEECNAIRKMLKPTASGDNNEKAKVLREKFISGCVGNGVSERIAIDLYEKILYFASYGFNKSHSVAYAINSYYCAWLLTYYETEWVTAYLESTAGTKKAPKALAEVKSHGFEIVPIDINYASKTWAALDNKSFMPSFYSCKGIGEAAINEIMELRPYKSIEDFLWNDDGSWKHSKCNKRVLDALIKIRALNSFDIVGEDRPFKSYKQLHSIVIDNYDDLKKQPKKNPKYGQTKLKELMLENEPLEEWSFKDLIGFENDLMGTVDVERLISPKVLRILSEREILPLDEVESAGIYWFVITKATSKKTKNGKSYWILECISSSNSTKRIMCWDVVNNASAPLYNLIVGEIENGNYGLSTKYSKLKVVNA